MATDDKDRPRLTLILGGKAALDSSLEDSLRKDEVLIREALRGRWGREPEDEEMHDFRRAAATFLAMDAPETSARSLSAGR
jgi:hypothetical protein